MQPITTALLQDMRTQSDARLDLAKQEIRRQTQELNRLAEELFSVPVRGRRAAMSVLRRQARALEAMGKRNLALARGDTGRDAARAQVRRVKARSASA
ncbi:MAG: hypothetical protein LLG20_17205 [Acidobacteriales bacterium]|nr:hypothetical protein [Terriglobales bacterium]